MYGRTVANFLFARLPNAEWLVKDDWLVSAIWVADFVSLSVPGSALVGPRTVSLSWTRKGPNSLLQPFQALLVTPYTIAQFGNGPLIRSELQ